MFRSKWESFFVLFMLMLFLTGLFLALYPYIQGAVVDRRMNWEADSFLSRGAGDPEDGIPNIIILPTVPEAEETRQYPELWDAMAAYNQRIYEEGQSALSHSGAYQESIFNLTNYGLPDETFGVISIPKLELETLGRFRNLLIKNGLQEKLFAQVVAVLMERGLILKKGTIVDSTIISAPSSTKNKEKKRDPDAHQVKKGNTWHFGYKAHIGVDKDSGLVHTVEATPANVHDVAEVPKLLTGEEEAVYGDSGYLGAGKREDAVVRNKAGRKIKYKINRRPSQMKKLSKSGQYAAKKAERAKSSVRAKVEHVFGVVKKQLRFRKTRYRGLEKQQAKFNIMFALANLILADRPCLAA